MSTTSEESEGVPKLPESSRGSSVSSGLQEEYQELLKYAIVTPKWDPSITNPQNPRLPQLQLTEPDHRPLTTVDEYSAGSSSNRTDHDSAMGSDAPETARRQTDSAWQLIAPADQTHLPQPMPSPGRTPYRRPNLSPTPSSVSEVTHSDPPPISSYLQKSTTMQGTQESQNGVDPDMQRMSNQLDQWHGKLRMMVLAELSQAKVMMAENHRREIHNLKQEHQGQVDKLQDEISQLKELLHTYEVSVERKDQVISNLTRAVQTGQDRLEMSKRLMQWKLRMINEKRETFTSHLAKKHRERALAMKAWQGWRSTIEAKWKERVEKACQKKAQEVCLELTNDYEAKLASLNEALESARSEVANLHQEREKYEETMKKAFMRGVCALNLEAMSMFQGDESQGGPNEVQTLAAAVDALTCASEGGSMQGRDKQPLMKPDYLPPADPPQSRPVLHPPMANAYINVPATVARATAVSANGVLAQKSLPRAVSQPKTTRYPINRSRTLSAKISGVNGSNVSRSKSAADKFGPPPQGVLIERHHPNIQNYKTEQPLSHVMKNPNTPTRRIAPQQMPLPSDGLGRLHPTRGVKGPN